MWGRLGQEMKRGRLWSQSRGSYTFCLPGAPLAGGEIYGTPLRIMF